MDGFIVKLRWAESYCTEYNERVKAFSADRGKAGVFDYEEAERIAHDVGGVVLARHEAMGDKA